MPSSCVDEAENSLHFSKRVITLFLRIAFTATFPISVPALCHLLEMNSLHLLLFSLQAVSVIHCSDLYKVFLWSEKKSYRKIVTGKVK